MPSRSEHHAIVAAVDGSPSSTAAVEWAAQDAELRQLPLHLVHVVPPAVVPAGPWPQAPVELLEALDAEGSQILHDAQTLALQATSPSRAANVTTEMLHSPIVPTLIDLSQDATMVVLGCRGTGTVETALLGSVSSGLVHHAHCPVAVIHDEDPLVARSPKAPVLVGIDGSPTSELATEIAFDEASRRRARLVALHAWSDMGPLEFPSINWAPIEWRNIKERETEVLTERLCGWQERYPDVVVEKIVVADRPAPRLLEHAHSAQLVVVGSHGRGGFPGMLLGSVSRTVVNSARIPVIVARPSRGATLPGS